ncbi:hypothetical protein L6164_015877 [Bauhinia variegata]|uniref:Uncharacterized protein n=1 Tax=Bauhinia variegata TaxID=167791 RepID=A0ACB9NMJ2_BAUVA|nr:hypothetical protein L6164_015877 [Bauhinia variegata]
MAETGQEETIEFKWGKRKGIGGKKKDVQFYKSFTYDGVEYDLYDSVYLYNEGEPEPYIGKLIKIWENADKSKKVKVLWFFRPCEILNFLGTNETCDNELFLAAGAGTGLANVNPLEAICGKCNVICISKDSRNRPPSDEEVETAEFVFSRFFDVGHRRILDKIDYDEIAGTEVKFLFNKLDSEKPAEVVKLGLDKKEINALESNEVVAPPSGQEKKEHVVEKADDHFADVLASENADLELSLSKQNSFLGAKPTLGVGVEEVLESNDGLQNLLGGKTEQQAKVKRSGVSKPSFIKEKPSRGQLDASTTRLELRETTKSHEGNISSDQTKMSKVDSKGGKHHVGADHVGQLKVERDVKSTKKNGVAESKLSKEAKLGDSSDISNDKDNNNGKKRRIICDNNEDDDDKNMKTLAPCIISSKDKCGMDVKSTMNKDGMMESKLSKKAKLGNSHKISTEKDNNNEKSPRLICDNNEDDKTLAPRVNFKRGKDSCDVEQGPSKKLKHDKKPILADGKFSKESPTASPSAERKLDCGVTEVTRRHDVDRSKWFRIPWEERMKNAHDQGRLVLFQNLSPSMTSKEVEDIVWHGFKESCTAKMMQATAFSSPHSGQAFVIFKTKAGAEMVIRKLDQGCLLLSNGRPLVAIIGHPCFPEKRPIFHGHLSIEQFRSQMQREMKDAVSTSHCSQSNNIEYDMAMEWCLLQERADLAWKRLYQRHGEELRKLKAKLKSK